MPRYFRFSVLLTDTYSHGRPEGWMPDVSDLTGGVISGARQLDVTEPQLVEVDEDGRPLQATFEMVDIIASGYEWTCPECDRLNHEVETLSFVTCRGCDRHFLTGEFHHAHG